MRWSRAFIPTLKENPQEAEAISHKLMVRAGLIRRVTAGAYSYLPMGLRALQKVQAIVREEMNNAGAVELLMPALQPPELWKKTGRYDVIGDVMIKYTDRHGKEVALGPTHEEIITDIVSKEVRSYKDLPLNLYQIQTKFRDEVRPRFGIVRSCEFIMKDAYSFDVDAAAMEKNYKLMYDAYCRIFERCGLDYVVVEADPGLMGGAVSHEFMVPSEIGEDRIIICKKCGYSASTEVAATLDKKGSNEKEKHADLAEVSTPNITSVEAVASFLKVKNSDLIKTLVYMADGKPVVVLMRGDHEANEAKIKRFLGVGILELADEKTVLKVTNGPMGFSGPVGLSKDLKVIADFAVKNMSNAVTGANKKDTHLKNVNLDRDFKAKEWFDARVITTEDACPKCSGEIEMKSAIEIGHTFKLGTKYSQALGAMYLDEEGKEKPVIMGCYGIGVNRILASLIERSHDENGIIWPVNIAPMEVVVIPLNRDEKEVVDLAEEIYSKLKAAKVDVIIDDRAEKSAGVKFKDSDLIGFPVQVIIGKKSLENGQVEIKNRKKNEKKMVGKGDAVETVKYIVNSSRVL